MASSAKGCQFGCRPYSDRNQRTETEGHKASLAKLRVGSNPEAIEAALTGRPDLSKFWQSTLEELAQVKPRYAVERRADRSTKTHDVFLVEMRSLGEVRVRGWLEVPKKAGVYPAVLRVPGYSSSMRPIDRDDDFIVFSFNVCAHGNSCDDVSGSPRDYWVRGLDDKSTYCPRPQAKLLRRAASSAKKCSQRFGTRCGRSRVIWHGARSSQSRPQALRS